MNQVWLNGRIAGDPEGGESAQGVAYAVFPIAVERGSGENKQTTFLDCVAFRQQADFIQQYFKKGDSINVTGSISVRDWTDSNGIKHRKYEIMVSQIAFPVAGKGRGSSAGAQTTRSARGRENPNNGRSPVGAAAGAPEPWDNGY